MTVIENALPIPELCDACCSTNISLEFNQKRLTSGQVRYIWVCHDCRATVGCHPNTEIPLGRMCDGITAKLRLLAHNEFDKLWRSGLMQRKKAYAWLSRMLSIEFEQCHLSQLSKDQLKDVITLSADYMADNYAVLVRRKEKADVRKRNYAERANSEQQRKLVSDHKQKRKRLSSANSGIRYSRVSDGCSEESFS